MRVGVRGQHLVTNVVLDEPQALPRGRVVAVYRWGNRTVRRQLGKNMECKFACFGMNIICAVQMLTKEKGRPKKSRGILNLKKETLAPRNLSSLGRITPPQNYSITRKKTLTTTRRLV